MVGDKEIILAHGCRQIKNICAPMNPNVHPPAKKQRVGGGTANDVSSNEERDDDSGDLVGMFNDVSSVEDEDIEDNSGCNGEDNSLLAPHGRQWCYCTSWIILIPELVLILFVAQHTSIFMGGVMLVLSSKR